MKPMTGLPQARVNAMDPQQNTPARQAPTLREATLVWLRIGLMSFGGPAGQIALMHKELVETRRWVGEERFLHALSYCMLLPGPEAQQLATYMGWLMHRTAGGLVAGLLFILPGALVMLGFSIVYAHFHSLWLIGALFFGIKAAVLALVVEAMLRIGKRALKTRLSYVLAIAAFVAIYVFQAPFPTIVLAAGLIGWAGYRLAPGLLSPAPSAGKGAGLDRPPGIIDEMFARGELAHARPSPGRAGRVLLFWLPAWLGPVALLWRLGGLAGVWTQIAFFFSIMAVVTFGGAYAVLAYVAQAAVSSYGWLTPGEMVDGLGLAETTPGPLILVLQFVGFLAAFRSPGGLDPTLAGTLGALLTLWVTFAPCFLWVFLGGPYVEALRENKAATAALAAITAAVVGVIANLALWFALHFLFGELARALSTGLQYPVLSSVNWQAVLLSIAAMVTLLRFRLGMLTTLLGCAGAGVLLALAGGGN